MVCVYVCAHSVYIAALEAGAIHWQLEIEFRLFGGFGTERGKAKKATKIKLRRDVRECAIIRLLSGYHKESVRWKKCLVKAGQYNRRVLVCV